jgi:hypothetical protein
MEHATTSMLKATLLEKQYGSVELELAIKRKTRCYLWQWVLRAVYR